MASLQKFFDLIVGVREPWCQRDRVPLSSERVSLPRHVELPACWRRQGNSVSYRSAKEDASRQ